MIRRSTAEANAQVRLDSLKEQHRVALEELRARIATAPLFQEKAPANLAEIFRAPNVPASVSPNESVEAGVLQYTVSGRVDVEVTITLATGQMLVRDVDPENYDHVAVRFRPDGSFTTGTALAEIHEFCKRVFARHGFPMPDNTGFVSLTATPVAEDRGATVTNLGKAALDAPHTA
ncbi:MAG TPA: hypothetical protein VLG09_04720 [Candidatus Saccharimonadales bacterium]|nr:hypothetical protein [Candidatus Saccharimonadales bacterium]